VLACLHVRCFVARVRRPSGWQLCLYALVARVPGRLFNPLLFWAETCDPLIKSMASRYETNETISIQEAQIFLFAGCEHAFQDDTTKLYFMSGLPSDPHGIGHVWPQINARLVTKAPHNAMVPSKG
jgi:hypothetical protein